jgi:hypothetical protein
MKNLNDFDDFSCYNFLQISTICEVVVIRVLVAEIIVISLITFWGKKREFSGNYYLFRKIIILTWETDKLKKKVLPEKGKTFVSQTLSISLRVKQKKSYGVLKPSGNRDGGISGEKSRKIRHHISLGFDVVSASKSCNMFFIHFYILLK